MVSGSFGNFVSQERGERENAVDKPFEEEPTVHVTEEFRKVLDSAEQFAVSGKPAFMLVMGMAGTGKSTLLRIMRQQLAGHNLMVVAPTGIAALNVMGETIHRAFHLNISLCPESKRVSKTRMLAVKHLKVLIIDEISMVRADILDSVSKIIAKEKGNLLPFGGVLVVAFGDLFQLPPVLTNDEREKFYKLYKTKFFFGANCLKETEPVIHELTHPFRQRDEKFLHLLGKIRTGEDLEIAVGEINRSCLGKNNKQDLILTPTNALASRINSQKLNRLAGEPKSYQAKWKGKYFDGKRDDSLPAPKALILKVGAKVMLTKNSQEWVNGTLGEIIELRERVIRVKTEDGMTRDVEKVSWDLYSYEFDEVSEKIKSEVVASYVQFPLRLAWACTIHKSQGLTLDSCTIDPGTGTFESGQAYVALSRCRSMEGLSLRRELSQEDVKISEETARFHKHFLHPTP